MEDANDVTQQIAYCLFQVGELYISGGMPAEAIQYLSESLTLRQNIFPELSAEVLSTSHALAKAFVLTDTNMPAALELFINLLNEIGFGYFQCCSNFRATVVFSQTLVSRAGVVGFLVAR